jgi:hypothetical protein
VRRQHEPTHVRARRRASSSAGTLASARTRRRATRARLAACGLLAPAPQPVVLLGDVRELEVQAERAQDERLLVAAQLRDRPLDLAHLAASARGRAPRAARARRSSSSFGPTCSTSTCPRIVPSRRTSRRSGSSARVRSLGERT